MPNVEVYCISCKFYHVAEEFLKSSQRSWNVALCTAKVGKQEQVMNYVMGMRLEPDPPLCKDINVRGVCSMYREIEHLGKDKE